MMARLPLSRQLHQQMQQCGLGDLLGTPKTLAVCRSHPQYQPQRVHAFVADLTHDELTASVPPRSIEMCTLIFVLSAIAPSDMPQASLKCTGTEDSYTLTCRTQSTSTSITSIGPVTGCQLSKIDVPVYLRQAIRNIARTLVPGSGRIFFRDYAEGDLAEARLHKVCRIRSTRVVPLGCTL